ncbi:TadE family type IV pilus minor pilin [Spelaeicoccus albus]|uniref:Chemotaxis response regulator CheB n=1 Tax=Spelaeicoccus albus TaxID=1280376 RepID=A0A7Z0A8V0_9MICO|nr:TadE family type IV pilus minor pilin [Spelaeicoccus albus]NYI65718.1 chemotaxis response regulator CheB [Spelaeicoccus albus]
MACRNDPDDSGTATAELAVLMPSIIWLLAIVLAAGAAGLGELKAIDGAQAAARQLARGESPHRAEQVAHTVAGDRAAVTIHRRGNWVTVGVKAGGPDIVRTVLSVIPAATATARVENAAGP